MKNREIENFFVENILPFPTKILFGVLSTLPNYLNSPLGRALVIWRLVLPRMTILFNFHKTFLSISHTGFKMPFLGLFVRCMANSCRILESEG